MSSARWLSGSNSKNSEFAVELQASMYSTWWRFSISTSAPSYITPSQSSMWCRATNLPCPALLKKKVLLKQRPPFALAMYIWWIWKRKSSIFVDFRRSRKRRKGSSYTLHRGGEMRALWFFLKLGNKWQKWRKQRVFIKSKWPIDHNGHLIGQMSPRISLPKSDRSVFLATESVLLPRRSVSWSSRLSAIVGFSQHRRSQNTYFTFYWCFPRHWKLSLRIQASRGSVNTPFRDFHIMSEWTRLNTQTDLANANPYKLVQEFEDPNTRHL